MFTLGDRNWYLPRFLEWVPEVGHEAPSPSPERPSALAFGTD
jgi:RND superfamily putative drug exporter